MYPGSEKKGEVAMEMDALVWLGILIVMLVIEIVTLGLTTIWFAGGALIAFVLAMFGANLWVQIPVFFVVSLVLLFVTRPIASNILIRTE